MNIYLETETNFKTNGLGFLTDCLTANVVEELNGEYSLTLTYPINGHLNEYLEKGNIIKTNVGDNNYQLFRIKSIEKNFKTITIYAIHIFYDLTDNFIEDTAPQNLNCYNFTTWILDKTTFKHNFTVYSDITSLASARYVRRNPVECIMGDIDNSIINIFGAELERDNFNIRLLKQRGSDNHVKLLIGKNIKDITISVDVSSLYTKILPIGYDGLMLPEKYIDSPLINNYPTPKIVKYEFSDIKYDPDD
jgi:phage minor structural protein